MNTLFLKKMGEVLAFSRVGIDTLEQAQESLKSVFDAKQIKDAIEQLSIHMEDIMVFADSSDDGEVLLEKADDTAIKLFAMRDMYMDDKWDEPAEVMEWMGFFGGGAVVHWSVVEGTLPRELQASWEKKIVAAHAFHSEMLQRIGEASKALGEAK